MYYTCPYFIGNRLIRNKGAHLYNNFYNFIITLLNYYLYIRTYNIIRIYWQIHTLDILNDSVTGLLIYRTDHYVRRKGTEATKYNVCYVCAFSIIEQRQPLLLVLYIKKQFAKKDVKHYFHINILQKLLRNQLNKIISFRSNSAIVITLYMQKKYIEFLRFAWFQQIIVENIINFFTSYSLFNYKRSCRLNS